jgi:hypothetical protein
MVSSGMLRLPKAALDSANCLRTASTFNRGIGMPKVDFVSREMNSTIISVFSGASFNTPMYLSPPASTIEEISASFKLGSMVFKPLALCELIHHVRRSRSACFNSAAGA